MTSINQPVARERKRRADHYDQFAQQDKKRRESKILSLRNANNKVKSDLLQSALQMLLAKRSLKHGQEIKEIVVLDLGCGKGGDLPKWGAMSHFFNIDIFFYGVDLSKESVRELQKRHSDLQKKWPKLHVDARVADFCDSEQVASFSWPKADIVSIQFALHYAFESQDALDSFMKTASDGAKDDIAVMIGTIVRSESLLRMWSAPTAVARKDTRCESEDDADANAGKKEKVFAVASNEKFEAKIDEQNMTVLLRSLNSPRKPHLPTGIAYYFTLEGCLQDCKEYLVGKALLQQQAEKHNFKGTPQYQVFDNSRHLRSKAEMAVHEMYCSFSLWR